jgi:hypothetical protein
LYNHPSGSVEMKYLVVRRGEITKKLHAHIK